MNYLKLWKLIKKKADATAETLAINIALEALLKAPKTQEIEDVRQALSGAAGAAFDKIDKIDKKIITEFGDDTLNDIIENGAIDNQCIVNKK